MNTKLINNLKNTSVELFCCDGDCVSVKINGHYLRYVTNYKAVNFFNPISLEFNNLENSLIEIVETHETGSTKKYTNLENLLGGAYDTYLYQPVEPNTQTIRKNFAAVRKYHSENNVSFLSVMYNKHGFAAIGVNGLLLFSGFKDGELSELAIVVHCDFSMYRDGGSHLIQSEDGFIRCVYDAKERIASINYDVATVLYFGDFVGTSARPKNHKNKKLY